MNMIGQSCKPHKEFQSAIDCGKSETKLMKKNNIDISIQAQYEQPINTNYPTEKITNLCA